MGQARLVEAQEDLYPQSTEEPAPPTPALCSLNSQNPGKACGGTFCRGKSGWLSLGDTVALCSC